jgi:hypothetical protein
LKIRCWFSEFEIERGLEIWSINTKGLELTACGLRVRLASTTDTHGGRQMEKAGERAAAPAREKRAAGMEQVRLRPGLAWTVGTGEGEEMEIAAEQAAERRRRGSTQRGRYKLKVPIQCPAS